MGGAAGGLIGARLVKSIGTDNLLLVLIPILMLVISLVQYLIRRYSVSATGEHGETPGAARTEFRAVAKRILASPYLKLIVGLLALSAIVTLIVDFQFKIVSREAIQGKDELTAFFATFYAYMAGGAFLLQVIAGSRIIEKVGVRVTLFVLPVALILGTATVIAFPFGPLGGRTAERERLYSALFN